MFKDIKLKLSMLLLKKILLHTKNLLNICTISLQILCKNYQVVLIGAFEARVKNQKVKFMSYKYKSLPLIK